MADSESLVELSGLSCCLLLVRFVDERVFSQVPDGISSSL